MVSVSVPIRPELPYSIVLPGTIRFRRKRLFRHPFFIREVAETRL